MAETADFLGFRGCEGSEPRRQRIAIAGNGDRLEPGRLARRHRDGGFGHAQRLAKERDHGGIGLALVGHGGDTQAEDGRAVVAGLKAVDPVGARVGRDAQMERQPGRGDAPGAQ